MYLSGEVDGHGHDGHESVVVEQEGAAIHSEVEDDEETQFEEVEETELQHQPHEVEYQHWGQHHRPVP